MRRDPFDASARAAMCEGKAAFDSAKLAHEVAKRSRFTVEAYRCPVCNHWHIGNPMDRRQGRPAAPPKPRKVRNRNGVRKARA